VPSIADLKALGLPPFDSNMMDTSLETWVYDTQRKFQAYAVPQRLWVDVAADKQLKGVAGLWFKNMCQTDRKPSNWAELVQGLYSLRPVDFSKERRAEEILQLKAKDFRTIEEFLHAFEMEYFKVKTLAPGRDGEQLLSEYSMYTKLKKEICFKNGKLATKLVNSCKHDVVSVLAFARIWLCERHTEELSDPRPKKYGDYPNADRVKSLEEKLNALQQEVQRGGGKKPKAQQKKGKPAARKESVDQGEEKPVGGQVKRSKSNSPRRKMACFKCGDESHLAGSCPHREFVCFGCKQSGHRFKECPHAKDGHQKEKKGSAGGKGNSDQPQAQ